MKVVQILYSGLGGHGSVAFSLIEGDQKRLIKHSMLFFGIEDIKPEYKEKCETQKIPFQYIKKVNNLDFSCYKNLYDELIKNDPDIVLLHSNNLISIAIVYAARYHKKLIFVEHTSNAVKTKSEWAWSLLGQLYADKIIVLTNFYLVDLQNRLGKFFKAAKVSVINNGVNTDFYKPDFNPKLAGKPYIVSMQARFSAASKDQFALVNAFAKLIESFPGKKIQLRFAGDGETLDKVKKRAIELKLDKQIYFEGMLNEPELLNFLQCTNLYVHVSKAEAMSTAVVQAMAVKLPIIATDIPGINNIVKHKESAWLVPLNNSEMLVSAMETLIKDEKFSLKLSEEAYVQANELFSHYKMFQAYYKLFIA